MRTLSGSRATSIRRRRPPRLNATTGWRRLGRGGDIAATGVVSHADLKPVAAQLKARSQLDDRCERRSFPALQGAQVRNEGGTFLVIKVEFDQALVHRDA